MPAHASSLWAQEICHDTVTKPRKRRKWFRVKPRRTWPYFWCLYCGLMIYRFRSAVWWHPETEEVQQRLTWRKRQTAAGLGFIRLDNVGAHALKKCWKTAKGVRSWSQGVAEQAE